MRGSTDLGDGSMIEYLMRQHLQGIDATDVLEVGAGYSNFGRVACEVTGGRRLVLVDVDPAVLDWQLAQCRQIELAAKGVRASLDTGDLERIDGAFDLILCQEVLEHLPNAEEVLGGLTRRLSRTGSIVITVPTKLSEAVMRWVNPSYMEGQVHGHVREFDSAGLHRLLAQAGLHADVFVPTQPHYFLSHLWLHATRMKVDIATGTVHSRGVRRLVWSRLTSYTRRFFMLTGPRWWGRLLPRNYFVVARRRP